MRIDAPGVYDLSAADYHADCVCEPSLSSSISKLILNKSPRHAWLQHPRLNPNFEPERKTQFDIGTAAHALLIGCGEKIRIVEAPDYKTKKAREMRDEAYGAGDVPLLRHQMTDVTAMVKAARAQLVHHEDAAGAFQGGKPEQTLVWQEGPVWCRARLDHLPDGGNLFFDYKTTGASANPEEWGKRQLYDIGADVQAAFYRRAIRAVLGIENAHFPFIVQETKAPYALAVIALTPQAQAFADKKAELAIRYWAWCLEHDKWPGYPRRTAYVDPPPWQETRWLEREEHEAQAIEARQELNQRLIDWMAPT